MLAFVIGAIILLVVLVGGSIIGFSLYNDLSQRMDKLETSPSAPHAISELAHESAELARDTRDEIQRLESRVESIENRLPK